MSDLGTEERAGKGTGLGAQSAPTPAVTRVLRSLQSFGVAFVLIALIVGFSIALPNTFPTFGNFHAIVSSQAILLILALAELVPLRSGDFDLSIASTMILGGSIAAVMSAELGAGLGQILPVVLAVGVVVGAVNGCLIVACRLNAFVVTLGTMTFVGGIAYAVTGSQVIIGLSDDIIAFARAEVWDLPLAAFYGWIIAIVMWYVFQLTPLGRHLGAVGENRDAARLAGLAVNRLRFGSFVTSGLLASFAGIVLAGTFGAVDPSVGGAFLLQPFAAAFLGAATVRIGEFNVVGCVIALYLLVVGVTGIQLAGGATWVSDLFNGAALVLAVLFARLVRRPSVE